MIAIVAAQSRNRVIGTGGQLPWRMPADMARFREITIGGVVVMGRVTYESIPVKFRPLPQRVNVVLSRDGNFRDPNYLLGRYRIRPSLGHVLFDINRDKTPGGTRDLYIAGGGQVYREALEQDIADRIYLTQIEVEVDGDTIFPRILKKDWLEIGRREFPADEANPHPYTFLTYHRKDRLPR